MSCLFLCAKLHLFPALKFCSAFKLSHNGKLFAVQPLSIVLPNYAKGVCFLISHIYLGLMVNTN